VYFLAMGLAQGDSWPRTAKRVREELPTAFLVELGFWPAVDVLNFKFIPVRCVPGRTATSHSACWVRHASGVVCTVHLGGRFCDLSPPPERLRCAHVNRHQLLCINLMSMLDTTFLSWIMLALDDTPWTQRLFGADRAACAKDASHIKNAP
jgi:hypothetical protein